jgi:metal-sulfur cluster biosynthetic enzyme
VKISNTLLAQKEMVGATEDQLRALECLYEVIDPELGIDIVDLGLVYSLDIEGDVVRVVMTMTTPACPLHTYLSEAVESAILQGVPGVRAVDVYLTFDPPWDPEMMSGQAKYQLGW